ncbi:MAG: GNAT family N-acetyltransferase [Lactobacillaceae bacterium]|jgi:predicted GNAT family N-acyltransferase|nr:GNAT family N-acetyltransferase [Lactobacillaceae bacterium]
MTLQRIAHQYGDSWLAEQSRVIRFKVFMEEQGVSEADELDDLDPVSWHFVSFEDDWKPVSTARVYVEHGILHVGRVATLVDYRGQGLARDIFYEIERLAEIERFNEIVLDAQLTARGFYEKLGYVGSGETFMDAGIEHIRMSKKMS